MNDQDPVLAIIEGLREEVRSLGARVGELEARLAAAARAVPAPALATLAPVIQGDISEEELLALSAAIAAFLGVRARIRNVRLVHSATWAQVGRVHIQASHRVH
jgi:methylmalonyl-CoA carboxyltransferase large subunit